MATHGTGQHPAVVALAVCGLVVAFLLCCGGAYRLIALIGT